MNSKKKKDESSAIDSFFSRRKYNFDSMSLEEIRAIFTERDEIITSFFERTHDAIFITSLDGKNLAVNKHAAKMLGRTRNELVGKSAKDHIVQDDYEDFAYRLDAFKKGEDLPIYERRLIKKDGSILTVEINASVIKDEEGKPKYIQSIIRDITKRKEIEKKLKRSEEQFRLAFEYSLDAIFWLKMDDFTIINCNQAAELLFESPKEEIIGNTPESFYPKNHEEVYRKQKKEALNATEFKGEGVVKTSKGKVRSVSINSTKIHMHGSMILQIVMRDISNIKETEARLKEHQELLQKQIDELDSYASNVAHDIRGKLQVISLYNELVDDSIYSEKISEQIEEMVQFLNNTLLLAKKGDIIGAISDCDLEEILKELLPKIQSLKPKMTITIHKLPIIKCDSSKIYQVFENLLMNVVKHSQATEMVIESKTNKKEDKILISDNGKGMTKETQDKINRAWDSKIYTTFGLMLAKRIIDAHNGTITFKSEKDKGTTFIITLPKS